MTYNRCQSTIEKGCEGLPEEAKNNVINALTEYLYLRNIVDPGRPEIEDLDKDDEGRVIIDFNNPHILKDMSYFTKARDLFKSKGRYTEAIKSKHKKSSWAQFWKEEGIKCLTYVVNPSTGEWISGDYYWYLNYSPIMRITTNDKGEATDRVFDFPDVYDGDYLYYHYLFAARHYSDPFIKGMHGAVIKARGRGYSFKGGSMMAKRYCLGESLDAQTKVRAMALASEKEYLTKDGILNKFIDIVTHVADNTGWGKSTIKNSWNSMEFRFGYTTSDGYERGRKNEVLGVSMKDNPGKARGKRANLILYEEFGKFRNLAETYRTNRPSVEAGPIAFGQCVLFGTGGEEGADFAGAEKMIYSPDGYRIFGIPNIYDKGMTGQTNCIFFSPEVWNLEGHYDKEGNSDVIAALAFIMYDRWKVKYNTSDPMEIIGHIAEHPICLSEAIMKTEGTIFPVTDLKEHRANIQGNPEKFVSTHLVGDIAYTSSGKLLFKTSTDLKPIREFPSGGKNKQGAIELFESPKEVKGLRYIIGVDPIDADYIEEGSLGSIFVFDLLLDQFVAEYTGRPRTAEEFYDIAMRLALYYDAKINYENNLKGMFIYFDKKNKLNLLVDTPKFLKDTQLIKAHGFGNRAKGTPANKQINAWARQRLADWMIEEDVKVIDKETQTTLKLFSIRSIGLIDEAIQWSIDINTDRISAAGMVMILREDYQKRMDIIKDPRLATREIYNDEAFNRIDKKYFGKNNYNL